MEGKKSYNISKRPLYREEIKAALMEAIISGELAPGERIVETRWAKEFGVSQSPIREAIRELEIIGLVENIPYKGCIVRKLTHKDIIDTYEVRIALETMALSEVIHADVEKVLEDMQESLKEMIKSASIGDMKYFIENDVRFHEAFVEASHNELLKRLWRQCYIRDNTMLSTMFSQDTMLELAQRHEKLYQALEKKDETLGKAAVKEHFNMLIRSFAQLSE